MKYYVIKTSNNKYLSYEWKSQFEGDELGSYMLDEVYINECNIFTKEEIKLFMEEYDEGYINYSPLIYEYGKFDIYHIEEVTTTPIPLENLDL